MVLKLQVGVQDIIGLSLGFSNGFIGISIKSLPLGWGQCLCMGFGWPYYLTKANCELQKHPPPLFIC
jgi:hypothetical protein